MEAEKIGRKRVDMKGRKNIQKVEKKVERDHLHSIPNKNLCPLLLRGCQNHRDHSVLPEKTPSYLPAALHFF